MKIRNRYLVKSAGWLAAQSIKCLVGSLRKHYYPVAEKIVPAYRGPAQRSIYAIWHENLLLPTVMFGSPEIAVLISKHADGRMLDELIGAMGMSSVLGSTNRGGIEALRKLINPDVTWKHLAVTPDGPRGPRRIVQPGLIYVAAKTGMSIVPIGIGYRRPFRAKSWDRFAIPKPFHRAVLVTGQEYHIPESISPETLEPHRILIQNEMDRVNAIAEQAAETGIRPPQDEIALRKAS
jgi:lysophospholipid acyltransferase (LPLAT)-like uncharacterized protein